MAMSDDEEPFIDPLIGRAVGSYTIEERIGEGGMCVVYRAVKRPAGRVVALKVMRRQWTDDPQTPKRFLREARISASLSNPNTVAIFDFGEAEGGTLFIAMELLAGSTLAKLLRPGASLAPAAAADIAEQVCLSLIEAHGKGIVHRDLKPENIFLETRADGTRLVKVLDYGLARVIEAGTDLQVHTVLTRIGTIMGTPAYMSPEQARGDPVDARSDLFSLGVVLYEMLTGRRPFVDKNPQRLIEKLKTEPPPPLDTPGVPLGLETLVMQLLEKDPEARPASARSVCGVLRAVLDLPQPPATLRFAAPRSSEPPGRVEGETTDPEVALPLDPSEVEVVVDEPVSSRDLARGATGATGAVVAKDDEVSEDALKTWVMPERRPADRTASTSLSPVPAVIAGPRPTARRSWTWPVLAVAALLAIGGALAAPSLFRGPARSGPASSSPAGRRNEDLPSSKLANPGAPSVPARVSFEETSPSPVPSPDTSQGPSPGTSPSPDTSQGPSPGTSPSPDTSQGPSPDTSPAPSAEMGSGQPPGAVSEPGSAPSEMVFEAPPDEPSGEAGVWSGSYQCERGTLRLVQQGDRVNGFFGTRSDFGRLWGRLRGDTLEFRWALSGAADDTRSQGRGVLRPVAGPNGVRLEGSFGYGERTSGAGAWTAVR
ncbi:MAG: protein kinase [Deltaproteobacteria bacterium]|nr:protein kinase [Deltaproteobacteria bacterium]